MHTVLTMRVFLLCFYAMAMSSLPIFEFHPGASLDSWYVVNDGVMGGRSQGNLSLDAEGYGLFSGRISLENNGGFSSIRYDCGSTGLDGYRYITLRVKGDGKRYQFRLKASQREYYSYIAYFQTNGQWQEIKLPLESLYPVFRGRRLDLPNFNGKTFEEIGILIGNKEAETFELRIARIGLE